MIRTSSPKAKPVGRSLRVVFFCMALCGLGSGFAQSLLTEDADSATQGGPIRLRQQNTNPNPASVIQLRSDSGVQNPDGENGAGRAVGPGRTVNKVSEFEQYVQRVAGTAEIRRFGAELLTPDARSSAQAQDVSPLVPADYLVQQGDELAISIWGSIDADLRLTVDRSGRITIPRVGSMLIAGTRYADLPDLVTKRVGLVFKNFQVSVSLGQLRGIRIYLTGFVNKPGSLALSSLSTITNALLRAGGPATAGSLRNIQLRRGRDMVTTFDLYDLLLKGDRSGDKVLQAEDVIHVGPVGPQVALIGSVNMPAIFEMKPGETVSDLLRMAGGFAAVADRTRLSIERLDERSTVRVSELSLPDGVAAKVGNGDVLRALSAVDVVLPIQLKNKRVRVEGEVVKPGEYVMPASSTLNDALAAAGGLTKSAHIFGTEFSRTSVRKTQQENYDRALRDLETEITRRNSTQRAQTADEVAAQSARAGANSILVDRLKTIKPTGRVVLELEPSSQNLPDLVLEDGDRIYLPPRSATIGVFGSVFNAGSYLYTNGRQIDEYLRLAGGPTKGADVDSALVIRANGSVVSGRQQGGWLGRGSGLQGVRAEAGDTVFVPEEIDKVSIVQALKDWTQIFYNLGFGAVAIKTVLN